MDLPSVEWWPSGPLGTLLLFLLPVGPSKTAGIMFGANGGLGALAILGLYGVKEILAALYLEPLLRLAARLGTRRAWARKLGAEIATLAARFQFGAGPAARLGSLALITLGAGFIPGAVALHNTPINRLLGWVGVIIGDLIWFGFLLTAALGLSSLVPDQRVVFVAMLLLGMLGGPAARRLRPATPSPAGESSAN